jgi:hypothetical protein
VIGEELCAERLSETSCLGFGFECLDLFTDVLVSPAASPFGFWWQWFANIWPTAELEETQFRGGETLAADLIVFLRYVERPVAKAAGVIAVVAEQSDSTATAAAADQYSTMFAETGPNPYDAKALDVTVAAHDFEARGREPQIGKIGIFEADVGLIDLAVIARNDVPQSIDID